MGNTAAGRMLEKWAKCWRQQELPLLPYESLLSPLHSCRNRKKQCENHPPSALPRQQVSSNRFSYLPGKTRLPGVGLVEHELRVSQWHKAFTDIDKYEKLVCETDQVCSFICFSIKGCHSAGFIFRRCFFCSSVHKSEHLEQNAYRTHLTVVHLAQVYLCWKDKHVFCSFTLQVPNSSWKPNTSSFLHLEPLVSCVPHCYSQEVSRLCRLPAGSYVIIPSTYLPNTEGSFTVIIATKIDR